MKTGNTRHGHDHERDRRRASMEPGHEDREYSRRSRRRLKPTPPQWSPAMKTGNTRGRRGRGWIWARPQWSPAMKTGNTSMSRLT